MLVLTVTIPPGGLPVSYGPYTDEQVAPLVSMLESIAGERATVTAQSLRGNMDLDRLVRSLLDE